MVVARYCLFQVNSSCREVDHPHLVTTQPDKKDETWTVVFGLTMFAVIAFFSHLRGLPAAAEMVLVSASSRWASISDGSKDACLRPGPCSNSVLLGRIFPQWLVLKFSDFDFVGFHLCVRNFASKFISKLLSTG